jgi:hypothetical protein
MKKLGMQIQNKYHQPLESDEGRTCMLLSPNASMKFKDKTPRNTSLGFALPCCFAHQMPKLWPDQFFHR